MQAIPCYHIKNGNHKDGKWEWEKPAKLWSFYVLQIQVVNKKNQRKTNDSQI